MFNKYVIYYVYYQDSIEFGIVRDVFTYFKKLAAVFRDSIEHSVTDL